MKWAAPELLRDFEVSSKSDVWSFGVVIWEVYSFGTLPYPGISNEELIKRVLNGLRLKAPENMPTEMAQLMKQCFGEKPDNRPSFQEVWTKLNPEVVILYSG